MYESTSSIASFDLSKLHDPSKESKIIKQQSPSLPPMYRSSDPTARFNSNNFLRETHLSQQTSKKSSAQVDMFSLNHFELQACPTSDRKDHQKEQEVFTKHKRQRRLSINIKSTNRELIESKEYYENKISTEWEPVFPQFNQQESVDIESSGKESKEMREKMIAQVKSRETKNFTPINDSHVKRVESKWLDEDVFLPRGAQQSSEQQFVKNPDIFTSSQDVQKLSQIYNQLLLKNDTKHLKKLNATNQQLKTVCKQIVSLLRFDPLNSKRKVNDELIISKLYKIIANYEHNKNLSNEKKS